MIVIRLLALSEYNDRPEANRIFQNELDTDEYIGVIFAIKSSDNISDYND